MVLRNTSYIGFYWIIVDLMMVVPFATNQIIASAIVIVFYLYLLYLITFRKIF
ncbi:hypothetical protein M3210_13260 [Oceanobacillus luteolus]|nr:hypothetical protein [Oceanobacillus luteolus]